MNTMIEKQAVVRTQSHSTHTFKMLLKREFWEHKGGFFWAPLISGAIYLLFQLIGGGALQSVISRNNHSVNIAGTPMDLSNTNWAQQINNANPEDLAKLEQAFTGFTMMSATWPILVFGFVVFFYLVNAMFEERKDKSILFWKSLPVSDTQTVLSKVVTALVVAPVIAGAAALLVMLGSMLMFCGFLAINGINPMVYLSHLDYVAIFGSLLLWIPTFALWALPTAGWLLMVSAWAKRVPFLWAVGVPVFVGVLLSWFDLLRVFNVSDSWYWKNICYRILASAFPGTHVLESLKTADFERHSNLRDMVLQTSGLELFTRPTLWIGLVAGAAMIFAAIRLRRFRDEG